jgi:hypothetical protein
VSKKYAKGFVGLGIILFALLIAGMATAGVVTWRSGALNKYFPSLRRHGSQEQAAPQIGTMTSDCHMIYETPGNPANSIELVFKLESQCDYGSGKQNCLYTEGNFYCGQQATLEGTRLEPEGEGPGKIAVKTLIGTTPTDTADKCCIPQGERDPDYLGFVSYGNPKFFYRIQWKQEWRKQGDNEPPYPPPPYSMSFSRKFSEKTDPPEICDFSILASEYADGFDAEIAGGYDDEPDIDHKRLYVFGVDGVIGELFSKDNDFQIVKTIYFKHNKSSFRMGYNLIKTARTLEECVPTFEKMIQSFQFLD